MLMDVIRTAMLGAKSARDAAAHRLFYKKAQQAQGLGRDNMPDDRGGSGDWCYVWRSDNPGKPTIQHGYARGAVALTIQLVDNAGDHPPTAVLDFQGQPAPLGVVQ
jgi:hypothetical protein